MKELPENKIGSLLRSRGLKLAVAESCTGGLVAHRITNVPGSSDYFIGGVVAYAYEAKVALLHVSWDTLRAHGAVSRETASSRRNAGDSAIPARHASSTDATVPPRSTR